MRQVIGVLVLFPAVCLLWLACRIGGAKFEDMVMREMINSIYFKEVPRDD